MRHAEAAAEAADTSEITFAEGIIGVPRARRFQLLERPGSAVRYLRCLDIEGFNLPVVDPYLIDEGYTPAINGRVGRVLGIERGDPLLFLAIAALGDDSAQVNLRAPLVINANSRLGAQVILEDERYGLKVPFTMPKSVD